MAIIRQECFFKPVTVSTNSKTKRKSATHSRTYYAKALGQKMLTVEIGAEFTYNGKKSKC